VAGLAVLALVAFVLPSKQLKSTSNVAGRSGPNADSTAAGTGTGGVGATGGTGGSESAAPGGGAGAESGGPAGTTSAVVQGSQSGVARSGVKCGPGVLQVP